MAKSLILPTVAGNSPLAHHQHRTYSIFRNCPCRSRSTPPNPSSISLSPRPPSKDYFLTSPLRIRRFPAHPVLALDSDIPRPLDSQKSENFEQWDSLTAKFAGASNIPFLVLQMPQIFLNAKNLLAGNKTALLAVPWLGMFTGLLGNLSLVSYFAKKRDTEAVVMQTLGVISLYVVFAQRAMAEAMPWPYFVATSVVVAAGLVLNFLNYFEKLNPALWYFWEDFITISRVSALPQVMWSTFLPYVPDTILPGAVACLAAVAAVVTARTGKLPEKGAKFIQSVSGWTKTSFHVDACFANVDKLSKP